MKHLSKNQLLSALKAVLDAQEDHYVAVKGGKETVEDAFFQLAGNIISIRERFVLPELKGTNKKISSRYYKEIDPEDDAQLFTIDDFAEAVKTKQISNEDGSGFWVKENLMSHDEVFHTSGEDATHVMWYAK